MDEALWALLAGSSAVQSLVAGRVFWGVAPQKTPLPYLVLNIVSAVDHPHMQGAGGFWQYRVQVDSYGAVRAAARTLSRMVRAEINGTQSGEIRLILFDSEREDFEGAAHGRPHRISQDYNITWRPDHG